MPRQVRPPETTRLDLTQGDWLLVKKRLTAGESRHVFGRMVKSMTAGEQGGTRTKVDIDPEQVGRSQAVEYLLDWGTFTDPNGKPLVIRDKSADEIGRILDALPQEDYAEIIAAIQAHDAATTESDEQEKNAKAAENGLKATSISAA
jgi:hypothetical protein